MALSPGPHPAHRRLAAEVIAIAILAQPPPLAGGLAGLPAGGLETIPLPIHRPGIRNK